MCRFIFFLPVGGSDLPPLCIANAEQALRGLGSAAKMDATTGYNDDLGNLLMARGYRGWGAHLQQIPNPDAINQTTGAFDISPSVNWPSRPTGAAAWTAVIHLRHNNANGFGAQFHKEFTGNGRSFSRYLNNGVWSPLHEVFDTNSCTVVENANGVSVRHPNGVQECWFRKTGVSSSSFDWFFPQPFDDPFPVLEGIIERNTQDLNVGNLHLRGISNTIAALTSSALLNSHSVRLHVKGRWKR